MNTHARIGIGVVVVNDKGQILLGKRNKTEKRESHKINYDWDWSLPGGGLDFGESFEECAIREVKEETNLDIENPHVISVYNDNKRVGNESFAHWVTIGMRSIKYSGEMNANEPDKYTEWKWFDLDKLPEKIFYPSAEVIARHKNQKVVSICGSMRFAKEQKEVAEKLELENDYCVIQCIYGGDKDFSKGSSKNYTKHEEDTLDKLHKQKIDLSDAIFVVNVGGYVGNSTKSEIEYAKKTGKEIMYLEQE